MISDQEIVRNVLEASGFEKLNPVQELALRSGLLKGRNMIIVAPTASGKTMIAEMLMLKTILNEKRKVVYMVPLRAIASEKYEEFKKKYERLGVRVAISIGDYDQSDPWLASYDLIVVSTEKMDSLLRHDIHWANEIGLIVADEIHLLDSPERGPTLEIVLTRLRQISDPIVLGLSATVSNHEEIAGWLKAKAVKSDWRPVKLYMGVCYDHRVDFHPQRKITLNEEEPAFAELVRQTVKKGKQALIFISTKKNSESAAEKLGKIVEKHLNHKEREKLLELSERVLHTLEHPTSQCERLSECIKQGVAFHHSGLANKQRALIENAFREGLIKIITATPTLAAGINLPAWRVIIRDLKRFSTFGGMGYIPVLEVHQMCGRAGRPQWDKEGEAILMAKNENEARYLWENYVLGEPEKIYSKLGVEPVMRMHTLALIASHAVKTRKDLMEFFSNTFYAYQYKDLTRLERIVKRIIDMLIRFGFVTGEISDDFKTAASIVLGNDELRPTKIGIRVSELYIDPLSAHHMIESMKIAEKRGTNDFGILHIISNTIEMQPLLNVRKPELEKINEILITYGDLLPQKPPNPWEIEYDNYIRSIKTAWLFKEWIEEAGEDYILDNFGVTPGELWVRLNNAEWLLYSAQELGLLLGFKNILKEIRKTRIRIKHGVKEELIPLISLKGIGRVRARILYNHGLRKISDLRKISLESLERIIGPKIAREIKSQVD